MKKLLFVVLALAVLVTGCDNAETQARADQIRHETHATATACAVEVQATATAVALKGEVEAQTTDDEVAFWENLWWWASVCVCALLVVGTVALCYLMLSMAHAGAQKARATSTQIVVSRGTRTYPVQFKRDDDGTWWIINLNTGERSPLYQEEPPRPAEVAVDHRLREVGLLGQTAADIARTTKSPSPGDMLPGMAASVPLLSGE